ncbi:hypothetical protein WD019_10935 [Fictibacillus sp. Mic-4]|uniref:hypothetical protein n=1 Tax=Fictibacillus sp. Mic-4 TaxID=3132826 RepID=UPI003CF832A3
MKIKIMALSVAVFLMLGGFSFKAGAETKVRSVNHLAMHHHHMKSGTWLSEVHFWNYVANHYNELDKEHKAHVDKRAEKLAKHYQIKDKNTAAIAKQIVNKKLELHKAQIYEMAKREKIATKNKSLKQVMNDITAKRTERIKTFLHNKAKALGISTEGKSLKQIFREIHAKEIQKYGSPN